MKRIWSRSGTTLLWRSSAALLWRLSATLFSCLALACEGRDGADSASATRGMPSPDSVLAATRAESTAAARDEWNKAEVIKRLSEAGLVVVDARERVRHKALSREGGRLTVGGSSLDVYVYDDSDARMRDAASLDTAGAAAIPRGAPGRPRFIMSNNLIAIHMTIDEQLAERVENVLLARHSR